MRCRLLLSLLVPLAAAAKLAIPEVVDFGTFNEADGDVAQTVYLRNTGEEPVSVTRVRPGCGCTAVDFGKDPILPGDSTWLELKYDPFRRPGRFEKSVKIYTTDGNEPQRLTITGVVKASAETLDMMYPLTEGPLRIGETRLNAGSLVAGEVKTVFVELYNPGDTTLWLDMTNPYDDVKIEYYSSMLEPGERGMIGISLTPGMDVANAASPREFHLDVYDDPLRRSPISTQIPIFILANP